MDKKQPEPREQAQLRLLEKSPIKAVLSVQIIDRFASSKRTVEQPAVRNSLLLVSPFVPMKYTRNRKRSLNRKKPLLKSGCLQVMVNGI